MLLERPTKKWGSVRSHRSEATKLSGAQMPEQCRAGQLVITNLCHQVPRLASWRACSEIASAVSKRKTWKKEMLSKQTMNLGFPLHGGIVKWPVVYFSAMGALSKGQSSSFLPFQWAVQKLSPRVGLKKKITFLSYSSIWWHMLAKEPIYFHQR